MYNLISVKDDHGNVETFQRGLAVEFVGENELTIYPVDLTPEEFNGIIVALADSSVSG